MPDSCHCTSLSYAVKHEGVRCAGVVPSATFQTKDGRYVIIGGNGDSIYMRLMTAVGRPDMGSSNPLYKSNSDRCKHEKEIYAVSPHHHYFVGAWPAASNLRILLQS